MRVSDSMLQNSYLASINRTKKYLQELQEKNISGKNVSKPSDSPSGAVSIMSLTNRIQTSESYLKNIDKSVGFLNETENNLNIIESEIQKVISNLALSENSVNDSNLESFAEQIDISLQTIMSAANADYEGKYLFAGTDYSVPPYDYTSDSSAVEIKSSSVSGEQRVNLSSNIQQKINITGTELFGTIIKQGGTLDSTAAVGAVVNGQTSIYNAEGTEYTLKFAYEKTAANTYELTYDIEDGTNTSIFGSAPASKEFIFDSTSGELSSIDGKDPKLFNIKDSANKIDLNVDFRNLKESTTSGLNFSANQTVDIFNTLLNIKEKLLAGNRASAEEVQTVKDFHNNVLDNLTRTGNVLNQMESTQGLLENRILNMQELYAEEQTVDQAKIILELESQDYQLQMAYKMSSMILPKSLLDYL